MPKRRTFKAALLQDSYDALRRRPLPEAPEDLDRMKGLNSALNAYVVGYQHPDGRPFGVAGSQAYASWAAGVDNRRDADKLS